MAGATHASFLPASLEAVEGDPMFIRAKFGIEPTAGPPSSFKPGTALHTCLNTRTTRHGLSELQPQAIQQSARAHPP
jgi:hypothetical protein